MNIESLIETVPENIRPLFVSMYNEIQRLQQQNSSLRRELFGAKSERYLSLPPIEPKGTIFNEAELEAVKEEQNDQNSTDSNPNKDTNNSKRSQESGGRKPLPANLPREQIIHDLPEEAKVCPTDLSPLVRIGEDVVEKLEFIPAKLVVQQHVYPKYACSVCDSGVTRAPAVPSILPKAQCEVGLLAEVIFAKYIMAIPLYRQETTFFQLGIELSRTSLARWVIDANENLQPLISQIKPFILSRDVIHADETVVQVLKGTGKSATSKCYMWTMCSGKFDYPAVWFEFNPSRSKEAARFLLHGFKGCLHVDGYDSYNEFASNIDITRVGCWAHARRNFESILKDASAKNNSLPASFMEEIKALFLLERDWKDLEVEERQKMRQEFSTPIVQRIRELVDDNLHKVPPKSKIASAMGYLGNDWSTFTAFLDDGRLELSNNRIENYIRPFAVGRKNWLFADTVSGANASAGLYSLLISARANNLDIREYLVDVLKEIPLLCKEPSADLSHLLPWNWKSPAPP